MAEERKESEDTQKSVNILNPDAKSTSEYKLILLKTTPGSCNADNLKIIGFTMTGDKFKGIFENNANVTKAIVAEAISEEEKMELDTNITRENLINNDCSSKQKGPENSSSSVASEILPNKENGEEKSGEKGETGDNQITGGSKKQSKRNRKNRRNRRSQKK